ncbi:probable tRNA (uracil-O(2)-)-methyltransferase, partial [Stegodyphus dumicola]|uniref:probable tRNA (uracil-O(2)-)-methyltransferase n=1 Tax=Stegodyphus dumicola TaxID=202533 RepID=UPI0015ACA5F8
FLSATNCVTFYPKKTDVQASHITPAFPYRIVCKDNLISLEVCRTENQDNVNVEQSELWLKTSVFPKVVNWSQNLPDNAILPSLTLVSAKKFNSYYQFLKRKYGKKYIEMWPECSDPLKYVYEDLSIAAYLMTTWEQERERLNLSKKQTFVDLGCGNGLLVSILSSEGYKGIGIDVRKRKIWDLYGSSTVLIEKAVEPSDQLLFPEYDWIIGNHSDELTPWIPVIAARSSYNMRVFLLPCCCYTFNGKYERHFPGNTQYQSYLKFLQELCKTMGFDVQQDKLRIPSTKRIKITTLFWEKNAYCNCQSCNAFHKQTCIVCQSRTYEKCDEAEIDALRSEFIQYHSKRYTCSSVCLQAGNSHIQAENKVAMSKSNHWVRDFIPREKIENVRNCTNLDKKFLEETVIAVAEILLKTENYVHIQRDTNIISWNSGGQISIKDLAISLDSKILKGMKSQCGGLQTFLRNHKNVFQVRNGKIQLQIPKKDFLLCDESLSKKHKGSKDKKNFHARKCYFHHHHPQGCPLLANECNFLH